MSGKPTEEEVNHYERVLKAAQIAFRNFKLNKETEFKDSLENLRQLNSDFKNPHIVSDKLGSIEGLLKSGWNLSEQAKETIIHQVSERLAWAENNFKELVQFKNSKSHLEAHRDSLLKGYIFR